MKVISCSCTSYPRGTEYFPTLVKGLAGNERDAVVLGILISAQTVPALFWCITYAFNLSFKGYATSEVIM